MCSVSNVEQVCGIVDLKAEILRFFSRQAGFAFAITGEGEGEQDCSCKDQAEGT